MACRTTHFKKLSAILGVLALAAVSDAAVAEPPIRNPESFTATLPAMVGELRQGGFVIFIRHGATGPDTGQPEDLERCDTQRNLNAKGRADAVQIGRAIKALRIPVGAVVTSPYCRAKDTARLAFGRYAEDGGLAFVMGSDAEETKRRGQSLRQLLGSAPEPGSNTVIVSHSANLYEAAGIFAKPEGASYIFRPLKDGRFEAVARVLPDEWSDAARQAAAR